MVGVLGLNTLHRIYGMVVIWRANDDYGDRGGLRKRSGRF